MELHLKVIAALLCLLSLIHIGFPRRFNWGEELKPLSLINKQMMEVHTFFVALTVMLIGLLCWFYANELVNNPFGRVIATGLSIFWGIRLLFQFFVYSPKLWRGKRFETIMHIIFSLLWIYLTIVFFSVGLSVG
ncbi:MAG: hypothetical protein M0D57_17945 [Sphingobacteriales bacterium JAD_PAG50586_3]|nr:MAG: hypothetical protein M0D57_17945 [Sphingobacteriales bacterium JAD_PAG50586_3]